MQNPSISPICAFTSNDWLCDSGCTYRVSPFKEVFSELLKTDKIMLWHNRLDHMSEKSLNILKKHAILSDNDVYGNLPFCDTCVPGKSHRVFFLTPVPANVSKCTLEHLYMDVWGPASVASHSGSVYFLSIIDDFLRKV